MIDKITKPTCILTHSTNPYDNIAFENWMLKHLSVEAPILFLWCNEPCVILGRFQNPHSECNLDLLKSKGVHLVRRWSGGGTVYQDLGNVNFTFLSPNDCFSVENNFKLIIESLSDHGISAQASGRNDVVVDGFKVSGSAFKKTQNRSFHHGTLLLDVDLTLLGSMLTPHVKKLESKGISSVRARVKNLGELNKELTMEKIRSTIIKKFFDHHNSATEIMEFNRIPFEDNELLSSYVDILKSEDWIYGQTPRFSMIKEAKFDWGGIEIHLDVVDNIIQDAIIFTDALDVENVEKMTAALKGVPFSKDDFLSILNDAVSNEQMNTDIHKLIFS